MGGFRSVSVRVHGNRHGPITRLISPGEIGEELKPFIFLDYFSAEITPGFGFPMHPHSGIATLTWQPGSDVRYLDTTGKNGILKAGGLEWMNAGGGAWHQGSLLGQGHVTGFQLWVPMPPGVEDGPSLGQYVPPEDVPKVSIPSGEIHVLLGNLDDGSGNAKSCIETHQDMNYFALKLKVGGGWRYRPPASHDVAWAFAFVGHPTINGALTSSELLVFGGTGDIVLAAPDASAEILIGSAKRHEHDLVLGPSSVHTNPKSLAAATARMGLLSPNVGS